MGVTTNPILSGSMLAEYFRNGLQREFIRRDVEVSETTEFYLVNLLLTFEKVDHLFEQEPLAIRLTRALQGDNATQIRELKGIGDSSLYISGFFGERLDKGIVGRGYYADMGGLAYANLASKFSSADVFCGLYTELSDHFVDLSYAFEALSLDTSAGDNVSLLSLYERWLRTGDEKLRKKLIEEGLIPTEKKVV